MKIYSLITISFLFLLLTSCAIGPLVSHETARTVGDSKHELVGGYGSGGLALKWNYGLSKNLDLGVQMESYSMGIRAKYAFINASEGFSLAAALGTGLSVGGSHSYGDILASVKNGNWEPYATLRMVHVKTDPVDFKDESTGRFDFKVDSLNYNYGQFILGTRYWFSPKWLLSVEGSTLFSASSGLSLANTLLLGAAFGYRF
jgi:hypothetical protein